MKGIGIVLGTIVLILAALYGYLAIYKDYAPRMENAHREVFKETQSYIDGKITHLNRLKLEYQKADEGHRGMLRETILTEASTVDKTKLPADLRRFLDSL